jgi:hypothetical protein
LLETDPEIQRDEIIAEHMNATKPTVLISPSLHLGLDLKDDLSRFQIITKVPYPSLGDRWIDKKRKRNEQWYKCQTALRLVQGYGRSELARDVRIDELKERIASLEEEVLREGSMRRKADLKIMAHEKKIAVLEYEMRGEPEAGRYDQGSRIQWEVGKLEEKLEKGIAKLERYISMIDNEECDRIAKEVYAESASKR